VSLSHVSCLANASSKKSVKSVEKVKMIFFEILLNIFLVKDYPGKTDETRHILYSLHKTHKKGI
jgi:hypothetical protein